MTCGGIEPSGTIFHMHRSCLDGRLLGQVHIQDSVAVCRGDLIGVDTTSDAEVSMVVADSIFLMVPDSSIVITVDCVGRGTSSLDSSTASM